MTRPGHKINDLPGHKINDPPGAPNYLFDWGTKLITWLGHQIICLGHQINGVPEAPAWSTKLMATSGHEINSLPGAPNWWPSEDTKLIAYPGDTNVSGRHLFL